MKGTAAIALQNETDEPPLEIRRLEISLKEAAKIQSTENHINKNTLQDHWTNHQKEGTKHRPTFYHTTKEYLDTEHQNYVINTFPTTPPWTNKTIAVDTTLKDKLNKQTGNPAEMKAITTEHITSYNKTTAIYTDGSKDNIRVAAAFYVPSAKHGLNFRLKDSGSVVFVGGKTGNFSGSDFSLPPLCLLTHNPWQGKSTQQHEEIVPFESIF